MFLPGDVLIRIDCRAWVSEEFDTRHHAMLVIDVSAMGYPMVAHMKFIEFTTHTGHLVIEPCPSYRDVILIRSTTFSDVLRDKIVSIAQEAYQRGKLKIEQKFLAREYHVASPYRWDDSYDCPRKLDLVYEQAVQPKDILLDVEQMISCHDFVLSVIQRACHALGESIPLGFNIAPWLAWSDILHGCCRQDKTLHLCLIASMKPNNKMHDFTQSLLLFKAQGCGDAPQKGKYPLNSCLIM